MRTRATLFVSMVAALTAAIGGVSQAKALMVAMPRDVPIEVMVTEADVIVQATVLKGAEEAAPAAPAADANVPAAKINRIRPGIRTVTETKFKVDKVIMDNAKEDLSGKEITVTVNNMGGPAAATKVGSKVVMLLKKNEGKYYTLPYAKAYSADVEGATKEIEKVANLDKWEWGKESNGVRAMALLRSARTNPGTENSVVQVAVALRNVGKESIFINTFGGDRTIGLKAYWDGTPVVAQAPGGGSPGAYNADAYTVEIKPGAVVWVSSWGVSSEGTGFTVQTLEGKIQVQATYSSSRDGSFRGSKLWKGSATTTEIPVEIKKNEGPAVRTPRGIRNIPLDQ